MPNLTPLSWNVFPQAMQAGMGRPATDGSQVDGQERRQNAGAEGAVGA